MTSSLVFNMSTLSVISLERVTILFKSLDYKIIVSFILMSNITKLGTTHKLCHNLRKLTFCILCWTVFVCVEVLRSSQPSGVMSSAVSLPNHTFTGQA